MSLKNGVIKAGTIVWKKVKLYIKKETDASGNVIFYDSPPNEKFNPDNQYHYRSNGHAIVKLMTLEDGVIPTIHRRGTIKKNRWEDGARKCRVPKAYVMVINEYDKYEASDSIAVGRNFFKYTTGTVITPDSWNSNPESICTHGIHVFLTEAEALAYSV